MKKQSSILFTALSKKDITIFNSQVSETIAFNLAGKQNKIFTTADLWNIQSNAKARVQRRYL